MSTAIVEDFIRTFKLFKTAKNHLHLGRILTGFRGTVGVMLSLFLASLDIKSLGDQFLTIPGLFGGSMCGLFALSS